MWADRGLSRCGKRNHRGSTAECAPVTWVCDPMHGNTFASPGGYQTRLLDDVLDEVTEVSAAARVSKTQNNVPYRAYRR
ncbi:3-deoxy-7-phosphoheptulonate synthase [Saccharopolyspora spinosa]|nr:3-deoxy-7-phosphoheptulonate synthase [Saccharopolyspora spinosa]